MDLAVIKETIWGDLSGIDEAILERVGERLNQEPEDLWLDDLLTSGHEVEAVELGELARSFGEKMGFQLEPEEPPDDPEIQDFVRWLSNRITEFAARQALAAAQELDDASLRDLLDGLTIRDGFIQANRPVPLTDSLFGLLLLSPDLDLSTITTLNLYNHDEGSSTIQLRDLSPLSQFPNLHTLYLGGGPVLLESLTAVGSSLVDLHIVRWAGWKYSADSWLDALGRFPALRGLHLHCCGSIETLDFLAQVPALERFTLICSKQALHSWPREKLKSIEGLRFLTQLQDLWIEGCWLVHDVSFLRSLPTLQSLQLVSCRALQDLLGIDSAPQLTTVRLDHCQSIVELEPLASLPKLKHLYLAALKGRSLKVRDRLKQLETLDLTGWDDLDDFTLFQGDA